MITILSHSLFSLTIRIFLSFKGMMCIHYMMHSEYLIHNGTWQSNILFLWNLEWKFPTFLTFSASSINPMKRRAPGGCIPWRSPQRIVLGIFFLDNCSLLHCPREFYPWSFTLQLFWQNIPPWKFSLQFNKYFPLVKAENK